MGRRGAIDTSYADERHDALDLGYAVCELFDAGGTPMDAMRNDSDEYDSAWVVASAHFLCPQHEHLLPDV